MRLLGTFVNFGGASESLHWQGHVIRTAWRQRRPQGLAWDQWHERRHQESPQPLAQPTAARCAP